VQLKKIHWIRLSQGTKSPTLTTNNHPLLTYLGHNQVLSDVSSESNPTQKA